VCRVQGRLRISYRCAQVDSRGTTCGQPWVIAELSLNGRADEQLHVGGPSQPEHKRRPPTAMANRGGGEERQSTLRSLPLGRGRVDDASKDYGHVPW
jgi:hypothetical protein